MYETLKEWIEKETFYCGAEDLYYRLGQVSMAFILDAVTEDQRFELVGLLNKRYLDKKRRQKR